jgi:hypothetical protein
VLLRRCFKLMFTVVVQSYAVEVTGGVITVEINKPTNKYALILNFSERLIHLLTLRNDVEQPLPSTAEVKGVRVLF